jgi:hypothetical protein
MFVCERQSCTNPDSNKKCQNVHEDDIDEKCALLGFHAASGGT